MLNSDQGDVDAVSLTAVSYNQTSRKRYVLSLWFESIIIIRMKRSTAYDEVTRVKTSAHLKFVQFTN